MNELRINLLYNGISINATFRNRINILSGYSGTGKTLLMQAAELFCMNNNIKCTYCDFRCAQLSEEQIENLCKNSQVIMFDNADLYLTNSLLNKFRTQDKIIIICMKNTCKLDMYNVQKYLVTYENLSLTIEEM